MCIRDSIMDGPNPHDELTPSMSARIIIDHVQDGVCLLYTSPSCPAEMPHSREFDGFSSPGKEVLLDAGASSIVFYRTTNDTFGTYL